MTLGFLAAGCQFIPTVSQRPRIHNPFPQLSKVAVVEFFNQTSSEVAVDGLQVAGGYFAELQAVPGYEVVPPDVVKARMLDLGLRPEDLADPGKRRMLATALDVDALVIGTVTDYSPYSPPRLAMSVAWYSAHPGYHPIPPGYGLPWGTDEEEEIPDAIVFEAELALAKEQLQTQTPDHEKPPVPPLNHEGIQVAAQKKSDNLGQPTAEPDAKPASKLGTTATTDLPPDWPDPRGFIPPAPRPTRPKLWPSDEPVMTHTRIYHANDSDFTTALQHYYSFRDDARFGGWQAYLLRSDDFIRFCCHLHIAEMLTARGGAGKTQVVWRWSADR